MIRLMLKRIRKQPLYGAKLILIGLAIGYLVFSWVGSFVENVRSIRAWRHADAQQAEEWLRFIASEPEPHSDAEKIIFENLVEKGFQTIALYEALEAEDYHAFIQAELKKQDSFLLGLKKGYDFIPPNYYLQSVEEVEKRNQIDAVYYEPLLQQEVISQAQAYQLSGHVNFIRWIGYLGPRYLQFMNLTIVLLLVTVLFSLGFVQKDRMKKELFRGSPYSNRQYSLRLFFSLWVHATVLQIGLLITTIGLLSVAQEFGAQQANMVLSLGTGEVVIPWWQWYGIYMMYLAIINAFLIALLVLVETIMNVFVAFLTVVGAIYWQPITEQFGWFRTMQIWNPFYYFDVARVMNGWKSVEFRSLVSVDAAFYSMIGGVVVIWMILYGVLKLKESRGAYV